MDFTSSILLDIHIPIRCHLEDSNIQNFHLEVGGISSDIWLEI